MKRSQMLVKLEEYVEVIKKDPHACSSSVDAELLLAIVELENGMLPPTQAPSLVEDTYHGGQKHGPAERVWDEE